MDSPCLNLLDEPLIRIRDFSGKVQKVSLPELFMQLGRDAVRDYPALRPHQRHPWHALLVQLAALALHEADQTGHWHEVAEWRKALLALTPGHPNGCAFALLTPHEKPAFLQAPVPGGKLDGWKRIETPDALDMLVTSKNHDLKGARMRQVEADDWLFALVSLQTQEGFLGAGNYGISRMNGGFSSRPALGVAPAHGAGARWRRDVAALLAARRDIVETQGLQGDEGYTLLWLQPWDGMKSLAFGALDPFYIEICRRLRFVSDQDNRIWVQGISTKVARIDASARKGVTGDAWTPVEEEKALTLGADGFNYSLATELAWGSKYRKTVTQVLRPEDGTSGIALLAQGVVRGQGKTEGYHERRIPLTKKALGFLRSGDTNVPATIAASRVKDVATMRGSVLRTALFYLLEAGTEKVDFERRTAKQQIETFVQAFEHAEDARFFDDLNLEIEADDPHAERLAWLVALAERAEAVLRSAFVIGPQCGERRYRARSRALSFFHGALRGDKHFPALALHLRRQPAAEEAAS
ncbi:MAG: type I-E CRISPR-associated protein Cse1/CasA [Methyloversatilis sp.]|uniref:type I-E CRISPR-associated protein Cse1/CasA n=1 Tax=Methyloversatilis sp. TaxID=2569862 RepID=UPI0027362C55|nr:type I-E CRISPR-associated protein Cse1/CasA [Methyloversatilis sp.]MDP3872859.1 type I-E CRISPR-associated protein Cse1/CasA [Methyloversatilis sp.]